MPISKNRLIGSYDSIDLVIDVNSVKLVILLPHYTNDLTSECL